MEELEKNALRKELEFLESKGIRFSMEGYPVLCEEIIEDMVLNDDNCTYMRNYVFQGAKIVEINFNRIKLY